MQPFPGPMGVFSPPHSPPGRYDPNMSSTFRTGPLPGDLLGHHATINNPALAVRPMPQLKQSWDLANEAVEAASERRVQQHQERQFHMKRAEQRAAETAEARRPENWRPSHEISRAEGLPAGWRTVPDPSSGLTYYWNTKTNETTWERPVGERPHPKGAVGNPPNQAPTVKGVMPMMRSRCSSTLPNRNHPNSTTFSLKNISNCLRK